MENRHTHTVSRQKLTTNPYAVWIYALAYRWLDVKTTYSNGLQERPLIAANRAFANLSYETRSKWKFDYTVSWNGTKRIPGTQTNPEALQMPAMSPDYWQMRRPGNQKLRKKT